MSQIIKGYTKIREVGSGSFGKAILVSDKDEKTYVMKVIDISRMSSKEKKEAMQEAKLLATLKHPYIVSYKDSWYDDGTLYIVMDYAENGDLCHQIQKNRKQNKHFPEKQIIRWFTQAVLAIKHLHDRHILHRDIKSSNFFLTATGRIRAGDFGIAKVLESTSAFAKTTIGTPYYLSPEICSEQPYSFASDIWSLGVVLYELCALKVPFEGGSIRSLIDKIITQNPAPLPDVYSMELRSLVSELLNKKASLRPSIVNILQRQIIQIEIREMLKEEQEKKMKMKSENEPKSDKLSIQFAEKKINEKNDSKNESKEKRAMTPTSNVLEGEKVQLRSQTPESYKRQSMSKQIKNDPVFLAEKIGQLNLLSSENGVSSNGNKLNTPTKQGLIVSARK